MDPTQILWLFFMLSAIQPVIKQRMPEASRQRLLAASNGSEDRAWCCSCTGRRR